MSTQYIGLINLKSLRDYILDNGITDEDTILLNQINFDNVVLEYRENYKEGITFPYLLLGVLIKEDDTYSVSPERIKVIKNDTTSERIVISEEEEAPNLNDPIYRCGWCGNVVDYDGKQLSDDMRRFNIGLIEKYPRNVIVKHTDGYCCLNRRTDS